MLRAVKLNALIRNRCISEADVVSHYSPLVSIFILTHKYEDRKQIIISLICSLYILTKWQQV